MTVAPHDIIANGEWDCVLFTTYALSLSFFEAHLLRQGLKKNGCREIWIIADAEGYAQSLAERQAHNVGQDYRLIPVGLPKGVFHPKCIYLHGANRDVLIVGSGNLTFGGFGNNVEVAEVFDSLQQPGVFAQFGDFLRRLGRRPDFENPDPTWVERFAKLAENAGRSAAPNAASPVLVHCVETSVLKQAVDAGKKVGKARHVRVLSPFFDPDAEAVRMLVQDTGAPRVTVGLLAGQEDRSTFPFGRAEPAGRVEAALVEVDDGARPLHAKWFEIEYEDGRTLTMTGSVNATRQSLCTTNNIEVSVLRMDGGGAAARLKWKKAKLPKTFVTLTRRPAGLGNRLVLHAALSETGMVEGCLLPGAKSAGSWRAVLSRFDGESVAFEITVGVDGRFGVRVPKAELFELAGGLQLDIKRDKQSVRGWVQNEWLLDVSRLRQVPTASILRFLRGEAEEEDDVAVLDFLTSCLDEVLPAIARAATNVSEHEGKNPDDSNVVAVAALAPRESEGAPHNSNHSSAQHDRLGKLLQRLFGHFEREIGTPVEEPRGRKSASTHEEDDDNIEETDEEEELRGRGHRVQKWIFRFREFVVARLERSTPSPQIRALCSAWLVVELQFRLRSADEQSTVESVCRHWLIETTRHCKRAGGADKLDERVLCVAAVLAGNAIHRDRQSTDLVGLHEALEAYGVNQATDLDAGRLSDAFLQRVKLTGSAGIAEGLQAILGARTRGEEIELVQRAITARQQLPKGLALLQTREGKAMIEMVASGNWPKVTVVRVGQTSCPSDYMSLSPTVCAELDRLHFSRCVQCGTFLAQK